MRLTRSAVFLLFGLAIYFPDAVLAQLASNPPAAPAVSAPQLSPEGDCNDLCAEKANQGGMSSISNILTLLTGSGAFTCTVLAGADKTAVEKSVGSQCSGVCYPIFGTFLGGACSGKCKRVAKTLWSDLELLCGIRPQTP